MFSGRTRSAYATPDGSAGLTFRVIANLPTFIFARFQISNRGRLATFDSTISLKAVQGAAAQNLELLAA
jgi:hypothetical protein